MVSGRTHHQTHWSSRSLSRIWPSLCCKVHADSNRGDFEDNLLTLRRRNLQARKPIFFQRHLRKQALKPDGRGSHRIPSRGTAGKSPGFYPWVRLAPHPATSKKTEDIFPSVRTRPVGRPRAEREFEFSESRCPLEEDRSHQKLSDQEDVCVKPEDSRMRLR